MDDPHDPMMLRAEAAAKWRRRVDEDPSLALDEPATDHHGVWPRTMYRSPRWVRIVLIACIIVVIITLSN